jgi:hypothetical protein
MMGLSHARFSVRHPHHIELEYDDDKKVIELFFGLSDIVHHCHGLGGMVCLPRPHFVCSFLLYHRKYGVDLVGCVYRDRRNLNASSLPGKLELFEKWF